MDLEAVAEFRSGHPKTSICKYSRGKILNFDKSVKQYRSGEC